VQLTIGLALRAELRAHSPDSGDALRGDVAPGGSIVSACANRSPAHGRDVAVIHELARRSADARSVSLEQGWNQR
jgi:hypothetical protein